MVGVREGRKTWGAQGGGALRPLSIWKAASGLRSVRTTLSQELLGHNIWLSLGFPMSQGERHKGTGGGVLCTTLLPPLLETYYFRRVAFMGIQAEWYRPWGQGLWGLGGGVEECGPQGPWRSCPACVLSPSGDQEDLEAAYSRSDACGRKAVGILCVSSFLRNRKVFFFNPLFRALGNLNIKEYISFSFCSVCRQEKLSSVVQPGQCKAHK